MTERTFVLLKTDVTRRRLIGRVLARIEDAGFAIVAMRLVRLDEATLRAFYAEHIDRPFFPAMAEFMTSGSVVALVLERRDAVAAFRGILGATDSTRAVPGTLRADFGGSPVFVNAAHGSDSVEAAVREAALFFPEVEMQWRDT